MRPLLYFAVSKLLVDGCSDWFQILYVGTDHDGEIQHVDRFTEFRPTGSQNCLI